MHKCQNLFSGKNKKQYFSMLFAENFTQSAKSYSFLFGRHSRKKGQTMLAAIFFFETIWLDLSDLGVLLTLTHSDLVYRFRKNVGKSNFRNNSEN